MHSSDRNNNLGKETISLNEEGQELKSTNSRQPQKNVVDDRDTSKEQFISNNYKVDEMHDSSQDTNSIEEKLKSNGAEVTAPLVGGSVGDISATASNQAAPIDADDKGKQTPNQSVEDQRVAPPDVEQVHKNGGDKFLGAQGSNNKEDTGKSEVSESEAQYVEKIKELSQELNRRATQVDTLTRELENKSKKLHNAKKEVRKFSKAISELREEFTESTEKLVSAKEEEINKLKNQITQLTKELRGKKAQPAEEEKELQDLEKQLYELCFGEEISKLALLTKGLEEERDLAVAQKLKQEESFKQAQQEINNLKEKLEREQKLHSDTVNKAHDQSRQYKAQLAEKEKALIDSRKSAQELEQVIENLTDQLEEARNLVEAQKLDKEYALQYTRDQLTQKQQELNRVKQGFFTKTSEINGLRQILEQIEQENLGQKTSINNLTREKNLLSGQVTSLSSQNQYLSNKISAANAQNRKQSKYTSFPFFIVAGTFAVVASLKTHYLAVWAALALPALFFFALGCHCLYKENTALNDVKVDQPNNQQLLESSL